MGQQDGNSETEQTPDILVKDQNGNFYYCPSASVQKLEFNESNPIKSLFGDANLPGVMSVALLLSVEETDLVVRDGQDLVLPGGAPYLNPTD